MPERFALRFAWVAAAAACVATATEKEGRRMKGVTAHPCVLVNETTLAGLRRKAADGSKNRFGFNTRDAWLKIRAKADRFVRAPTYSYSVDIPLPNRKHAGVWAYTLSDETPPRHDDTPYYPPWTAMFQERSDSITTRLTHLSFAFLLTGKDAYFQRAKTIALHLSKWRYWTDPSWGAGRLKACLDTGHCTYAMAMFYDWCFPKLTEAEKQRIRNALATKGVRACLAGIDKYPPDTNGYAVILSGATLGAIALRPEMPEADSWLRECIEKFRTSLDRGGKDGGAFEGPMYGTYLLDSLAKALDGLEAARIPHDLFEHPYLSTMVRYCVGLLAPDTRQIPCFGDGSPTAGYPEMMEILALRGSPEAAWYLQQIGALDIRGIYDFIRFDAAGLTPRQPAWNPSSAFVDIGYASLRNGYDRTAPTLFFKSGPYTNNIGHNHFDQNAFVISYGGQWIVPDRGYHSRYDPHERKFSLGSLGHCTVVLDVDRAYLERTRVPDPGHDQVRRTGGRIVEFFPGAWFDYVKGQAAEAYNSARRSVLDRFERSIVFVKPLFFVVHDRLVAPDPHAYSFLLHTDGLGTIESFDDHFIVSRTTGQVYGRILASTPTTLRVETCPGAERYGPYLRVETEPVRETEFTTFLYPRLDPTPQFLGNGGFERGMAGWRPRANEDRPNHRIVSEHPAEGEKCARIERSGYYYSERFSLAPGTKIVASVKVRTTDLPSGKGATMTLYFWRGGKAFAHKRVGPFAHTDWRQHTMEEVVPKGTEQVSLALEFFAPGTGWFDDAHVSADLPAESARKALTPRLRASGPEALDVTLGDRRWFVVFGGNAKAGKEPRLTTDAELAVIGLDTEGRPAAFFLKGGSFAAFDHKIIVRLDRPGTVEVRWTGDSLSARVAYDTTPHAPLADAPALTTTRMVRQATLNGRPARIRKLEDGRCRLITE
ncbi:MAG: DUF4962 domain-containing protein [Kiritimatiellaeota bacterium]|nr:DUF4962 domain-containing protein [Kiritimatiellota bacterium]